MNKEPSAKILFLGKADDPHCIKALDHLLSITPHVTSCFGKWGDALPTQAITWSGHYIISYLSRWIVSMELLGKAQIAAINFHPAPPNYPGIGCFNFALYDEVEEYGITCHHMTPKVDAGKIIAVERFAVLPTDNVNSLIERSYDAQFTLLKTVSKWIQSASSFPHTNEKWTSPPRTRDELNALSRITTSMNEIEISRRIRATSFKDFQPYIELANYKFEYKPQSTH
jgi:methionyl-tRNA formyltransferase